MTTWVSAACTLPTTEQPLRVCLVLTGGLGIEGNVRDLVARESGCCSFFTITVRAGSE
ncbi:hypothetical protein OHA71_27115 [Streptomyces sp. NBC_00444]|uniref:hypothetical protein n=1 Tax=Streptomyces sp. NBC_00444 TaxID=2975744 RepID=UPI002E1A1CE3